MKLRAIDCHKSQLEDWRIAIRDHPHLMQKGYGHEPYIAVSSQGKWPDRNRPAGRVRLIRWLATHVCLPKLNSAVVKPQPFWANLYPHFGT